MSKTLLIISGQPESVAVAQRVKAMGHTIVISDGDPHAPAFAFADSCLIADIHGAPETAAAAERYSRKIRPIDGVVSTADAVLTATTVAQRLRLPGLPLHVGELVADRLAIRRCFQSAGVASPWSVEISTLQELQRIVIARGHALVLKPVANRGSDGVTRLMGTGDLNEAFLQTRSRAPEERVMVEQYPPGIWSTVLIRDGICRTDTDMDTAVHDLLGRAAAAMDIRDGLVSGEIAIHQDTPVIGDISVRLTGHTELQDTAIRQALNA
jgi:biotin carboxylase